LAWVNILAELMRELMLLTASSDFWVVAEELWELPTNVCMVVGDSELSLLIVDKTVLVLLVIRMSSVEDDAVVEDNSDVKESKDDDSAEVELYKMLVRLASCVNVAFGLSIVVSWELVVLIVEKLPVAS
jgi:hypothetical protein